MAIEDQLAMILAKLEEMSALWNSPAESSTPSPSLSASLSVTAADDHEVHICTDSKPATPSSSSSDSSASPSFTSSGMTSGIAPVTNDDHKLEVTVSTNGKLVATFPAALVSSPTSALPHDAVLATSSPPNGVAATPAAATTGPVMALARCSTPSLSHCSKSVTPYLISISPSEANITNPTAVPAPLEVVHAGCSTPVFKVSADILLPVGIGSAYTLNREVTLQNNIFISCIPAPATGVFVSASNTFVHDAALQCFSSCACNSQKVFKVTHFSFCTSSVGGHVCTEHFQHNMRDASIALRNLHCVGNSGSRGHKPSKPPWPLVSTFSVDDGKHVEKLVPKTFYRVEVQWKPPQKWLVSRNCANYYLARNFVMWSYQHCFVDYRQEQSSDFNLSVTSLTKAAEQILPVNIYHVYLNEKELQQPWPPPIHKQLVSSGAEVPPTPGMFSYFIQGSALQVSPRSPPLCKVLYCPACVHPGGQMSTDLVALGCSKMSAFLQYYKDRDNWFCASDVISVIQFSLSNPTNMSCDTTDSRESILIIELHLAWDPGNGATMVNGHASMRKAVHSNGPFLLAVSKSEKLKVALVDLQNINSTHQRPDNQFLVLEFSCSKENVGLLHLPQWSSPVSWHYMSLFPGSNQMTYKVLEIFPELGEHYCNIHERSIHEGQGFLNQLQISLSKFTARCGATQLKHVQAAAPRELEQFWRQAVCLLIVQDEFLSDFTDQEVKYTYCSPMLFTLPEHLTIFWYYLSAVVQQAFQSLAVFQIALIIAELEAPWDPGDSMSVNNGLGASRVLRRGECQDTSQSRASSRPSPVNPAPSAAGPAPDEAVAAHLQLDDAAAAVAPDLPPKEVAAAHLSAVVASAPSTCRPTRP